MALPLGCCCDRRCRRFLRRLDHQDTVFQTRPDVQIAYVGTHELPVDTVNALQDALTPFCHDENGDGKVVVQVATYNVDFDAENESTDAYYQMAGVTRLSAELASGGKTYIFLLEDPEGFEKSTGALQYLDGTVDDDPETADPDWREMVYRWTDCPVLTGLELGSYDGGYPDGRCDRHEPERAGASAWAAAASGMKSRPRTTPTAPRCGTP